MTRCSALHEFIDLPNPRTSACPRLLFDNSPTSPAHLNPRSPALAVRAMQNPNLLPTLAQGLSSIRWRLAPGERLPKPLGGSLPSILHTLNIDLPHSPLRASVPPWLITPRTGELCRQKCVSRHKCRRQNSHVGHQRSLTDLAKVANLPRQIRERVTSHT